MAELNEADLDLTYLDSVLDMSTDGNSNARSVTDIVIYLEKVCERLNRIEQFYFHESQSLSQRQTTETAPIVETCIEKKKELGEHLSHTKSIESDIREQIALLTERVDVATATVRASIRLSISEAKINIEKNAFDDVMEQKRNTSKVYESIVMQRLRIENQIGNLNVLCEELDKTNDEHRDYNRMQQQMTAGCFQVSFDREVRDHFLTEIGRLRRNRRIVRQYNQKIMQIKKARNEVRNRIAHLVSRYWR